MRPKLLLAALGLGIAGAVLPAAPASAICIDWYWELTGDCSPCHTLQRVVVTNCVQ